MTSSPASLPYSSRLSRASRCPITELSPTINDQASRFFVAVVSLIWPYSSSDHRTAILLADPDFRRRRTKGQTKVTFHGRSAVAVAESHVGIGDTVRLSLEDAQWIRSGEDVSTLGKRADWDLEYAGKVLMEIHRGEDLPVVVEVNKVSELPHDPPHELATTGGLEAGKLRISRNQEVWTSPAFAKQISPLLDPMAEIFVRSYPGDHGHIPGRARKRTKFSRESDSWRYVDRSSSADENNDTPDSTSSLSGEQFAADAAAEPSKPQPAQSKNNAKTRPISTDQKPVTDLDCSAAIRSEGMAEDLMPPPSIIPAQQQRLVESSIIRPEAENEVVSILQAEEGQKDKQYTPTPGATTPRLLPLASPGLPLISPLIRRGDPAFGYFPHMSGDEPELEPSAEIMSNHIFREVEHVVPRIPTRSEVLASESVRSISESATAEKILPAVGETIDLTSPTEEKEEPQREAKGADLQFDVLVSNDGAVKLGNSVSSGGRTNFVSADPVGPEAVGRVNSGSAPDQRPNGTGSTTLLKALERSNGASTTFNQTSPSSPEHSEGVSRNDVTEPADLNFPVPRLEQPDMTSLNQVGSIPESDLASGIATVLPKDIKQNHTPPNSSSALQIPPHRSEALEVLAKEVEHHDPSLSPPPLPLKRRWDVGADAGSQPRQASHEMQPNGSYVSLPRSYDGVQDGVKNSSGQLSDTMLSCGNGDEDLLYDADDSSVREEVEDPGQTSGSGGSDSEPEVVDVSNPSGKEIEGTRAFQSHKSPPLKGIMASVANSETTHDLMIQTESTKGAELEAISSFSASDVQSADDDFGHQSPRFTKEQDYVQHLPELSLSQSPPHADGNKNANLTISSAARNDSGRYSDVKGHVVTSVLGEEAGFADHPVSIQPSRPFSRADQLATPDNTQPGDLETEPCDVKPQVHLPPSPQDTQEHQDNQPTEFDKPLDVEEEPQMLLTDHVDVQPVSHSGRDVLTETVSAASSKISAHRRRSSRLSLKFPLLGKNASEIVSPYFTPKASTQHTQHDVSPPSPLHRPLSGIGTRRHNLVVVIPPPADHRSSLDMQDPDRSPAPLSNKSPSGRHSRSKGFTTSHSYYPSLASLPTHFNERVDVLAVAITTPEQPQRAKSGPKDYFISSRLVDSSCEGGDAISLQLFRPYENALPACTRGDVMLLRAVKVQTRPTPGTRSKEQGSKTLDRLMLLSTESSAWAVFRFPGTELSSALERGPEPRGDSARSAVKQCLSSKMDVVVSGPPVEYGAEERAFAKGLKKWWIEEGEAVFPPVRSKPRHRIKGKGKEKLDELDGHEGNLHEHELRDGMAYGDMISPRPLHEHFHRHQQTHVGGIEDALHEHELRDGMAYGDTISPKPLHDHQHDPHIGLHYDPSPHISQHHTEPVDEEITLHEHELRDGMAYGDTISPKPLHEHLHHPTQSRHGSHNGVTSVVPAQLSHGACGIHRTVPQEDPNRQPVYSHHLRNGVSYGKADAGTGLIPTWASPRQKRRSGPGPGSGFRSRTRVAASEPADEESGKTQRRRNSTT